MGIKTCSLNEVSNEINLCQAPHRTPCLKSSVSLHNDSALYSCTGPWLSEAWFGDLHSFDM